MVVMGKETLLADLNRLLDAGEPLLALFPKLYPESWEWELALPDTVSPEMAWYANAVSIRALDPEQYQDRRQHYTTYVLAERVKDCEVGLLGWRAIGVLK